MRKEDVNRLREQPAATGATSTTGQTSQSHDPGRSGVVLGNRARQDLERHGAIELVGRHARSLAELADIAQVYRDAKVETVRVFFLRDGKIVHATAVSINLVDATVILPSGTTCGGQRGSDDYATSS